MTSIDIATAKPSTSLLEVLRLIDRTRVQIALVEDEGRLVGTLTDGDIRRAILAGTNLDAPASEFMNRNPITARIGVSALAARRLMQRHSIHQLPVIDDDQRIVDLLLLDKLLQASAGDNLVVLMAGGLGSRLKPLTDSLPKPLIKIGDRPILETIVSTFANAGFRRFVIAVNYKAEMIEAHFGDGSKLDVEISYVHEREKLGTAGALSLLSERPSKPFFVMNGDLLTTINFQQLMSYHTEHGAMATMCVRKHDITIPYGVVAFDDYRFTHIREKPTESFFVNAGVYVLDPATLDLLTPNEALDMPQLFDRIVQSGKPASVFPLREYWIDVGRLDDLQRASEEYERIFG